MFDIVQGTLNRCFLPQNGQFVIELWEARCYVLLIYFVVF